MGAIQGNEEAVGKLKAAAAEAGKQFRAPGVGMAIKEAQATVQGMVNNTFGSGLKDTLGNLKDTVTDIPLAPGYSIDELGKDLGSFSKDGLSSALENITGVNLAGMVPTGAEITGFVKGQLSGTLNALQAEILAEIQGCIENYLRELLNKIPELVFLLNFKKEIAKLIAGQRIKLQRMIQGQLEKLAFQKLKVQQIALLKQKLIGSIRGLCKGAPGASIRNFQSNPLAIVDTAKKNAGKLAKLTQERAQEGAKGYDETKSEDIVQDVEDRTPSRTVVTQDSPSVPSRPIPTPPTEQTNAMEKKNKMALVERLEDELAKMEAGEFHFFMRGVKVYHITRDPADKDDKRGQVTEVYDLSPWKDIKSSGKIGKKLLISPVKYTVRYLREEYGTNREIKPKEKGTSSLSFIWDEWMMHKYLKQKAITDVRKELLLSPKDW